MNKYQKALDWMFNLALPCKEEVYAHRSFFLKDKRRLLQELVERATPKKPIIIKHAKNTNIGTVHCPSCNYNMFGNVYEPRVEGWNCAQKSHLFCDQCGQALSWSNDDEK